MCTNYIQALRILRSHGLCNDALHLVYRSTVIGKLLYAVNAWWGFSSAAHRHRAVRRRAADRMSASRRRRFCDVFTSRCTPAICC